jgi:hypothetical protein
MRNHLERVLAGGAIAQEDDVSEESGGIAGRDFEADEAIVMSEGSGQKSGLIIARREEFRHQGSVSGRDALGGGGEL